MVRSPLLLFLSSRSIETRHCHSPSSSTTNSPCLTQKSSAIDNGAITSSSSSRWRQRTANKRRRTEELLDYIENYDCLQTHPNSSPNFSSFISDDIPTLRIPSTSLIDWDTIPPELDPMRGGRIRSNDSAGMKRGIRKRLQIQAFYYLLETIIHQRKNEDESTTHRRHPSSSSSSSKGLTIIDAGCGAGNLAISLAGLLLLSRSDIGRNVHILAVDINEVALDFLTRRAAASLDVNIVQTLCADLSEHERILSHIPIDNDVVVLSLHACGAASDYAMELAYRCKASFIVCPCCTAKSLTRRDTNNGDTTISSWTLSSSQRSGSSIDIEYPRSVWLRDKLSSMHRQVSTLLDTGDIDNKVIVAEEGIDSSSVDDFDCYYSILAKVADVGLGPQTPSQQRVHQRRAKRIVELDRAMRAVEQHEYNVHLMRLPDDDPWGYSKGEVMIGLPHGSAAASRLGLGTILSSEHVNSDDLNIPH